MSGGRQGQDVTGRRETTHEVPELTGDAAAAVAHRGGHVQIIASAGSGKTEVVSQRVAALLADGEPASSIVAFTFTEKAAAELKERIRQRVLARLGEGAQDQLGRLFVGTIHGYCFQLLRAHSPRFETFTPLDPNQLTNLLYREATRLKLKSLGGGKVFDGIKAFQTSIDVIENELIEISDLPADPFREAAEAYYAMLERYSVMSFGTMIVNAVNALADSDVHDRVTDQVRHLIVDEYQDVNPAQERLISLLARPMGKADLVVVGDDDQAIYQWRGSNVANIVTFTERFDGVTHFELLTNRRSRPGIVGVANAFAQSIPDRLAKAMDGWREAHGPAIAINAEHQTEKDEAEAVAAEIVRLHEAGVAYRDIAILVRGKVAYPKLLDALEQRDIPVQPGGRTGLFEQPEAAVLGATFAWLVGYDWAPKRFTTRQKVELADLLVDFANAFGVPSSRMKALEKHLVSWHERVSAGEAEYSPSLVAQFYALAALLGVADWDLGDSVQRNRLGTLGRFTTVLADYEAAYLRARRDPDKPGEQVGGSVGDTWFYRNFASLLLNYATGNYDDFDGEQDLNLDAVALGTVHGAKGLEWPVVFLPSLTRGRFPSSKVGQVQQWLVPRHMFDAARYEGSDADERRLFYVAVTRARDWLSLSAHKKVLKQNTTPSVYLTEARAHVAETGSATGPEGRLIDTSDVTITYSEIEAYLSCPQSYLLRSELGFMPAAKAEIGYGNAVHHILRVISERAKATGEVMGAAQIDALMREEFYLPFANKVAHKEMQGKARELVQDYVHDHRDELLRTWATEYPFELYLPGAVVSGRADVIYDEHDGVPERFALVDYKTSVAGEVKPLQLQLYASAGRREGLSVDAAYVHDMATATRHAIDVSPEAVSEAERVVRAVVDGLKAREFRPSPERRKCASCDVRAICKAANRKA
jgi:DNA helicase-2/ATP-dependent DNA helicase PcrA